MTTAVLEKTRAPAVSLEQLVRRYPGPTGVLGVDLAIPARGVTGLVGPNGAGKTTLLQLLAGLDRPDSGTITVNGRLALCPDTPEFEPWLTAPEVLRQSAALAQAPVRIDDAAARQWLDRVGLGDVGIRRVGAFSRGMTQRLGIAAAMVVAPDVLLLDEPTSALDTAGRAEMLRLMQDLGREHAVLLSSHSLTDVERICDQVAVMAHGTIRFAGRPAELIGAHRGNSWRVVAPEAGPVVASALRGQPWANDVQVGTDEVTLNVAEGNYGPTDFLRVLGPLAPQITTIHRQGADLESAFLRLVSRTDQESTND